MGREETVISQLAKLYESYGYSYYKVSRFEEQEFPFGRTDTHL